MTGSVRGFSFPFVGPLPPPPLEKGTPFKTWDVREFRRDNTHVLPFRDHGTQDGGVLEKNYDFGEGTMTDPGLPLPDLLPREFRSTGRIFSSAGGGSYGVSTEAPVTHPADGGVAGNQLAGNLLFYSQSQKYRKRDANAKLSLHITQARIESFDDEAAEPLPCNRTSFDPDVSKCPTQMEAYVKFNVDVSSKRLGRMFDGAGKLSLQGWRKHWTPDSTPDFADSVRLWDDGNLEFDPDVELADGRHAHFGLKNQLVIPIDISAVDVNETFTVFVRAQTFVFDGRDGELNYLGAFFRDPTRIDGDPQLIAEGLDPADPPDPEPPSDDPSLPAECRGKPSSGALALASPTYDVLEGAGAAGANLLIVRNGGSAGEVTATVSTSDGTATAPDDYLSVRTTVTFEDGEIAPQFVRVPLVYSTAAEGDKTFTVTLSGPTGCATLGNKTSVVTILDDTRPVPPSERFALGGTVSGLLGTGLVLRDVFTGETVSPSADGAFTFAQLHLDGTGYDVRIDAQPTTPIQGCTISHGLGTISGADVTDIAVTCTAVAAPGSLDPSFGNGGRAVTSVAYSPNLLGARIGMALQSDGKILLVGGLKLLRLNTDGTLDATFGAGGVVDVVFGGGTLDTAMDVAVQIDGKIVVAGTTSTTVVGSDNFALTRFDSRGALDTTFGTGGHVTTDFFGSTDQVRRMRLQDDGKILVVGRAVHLISPSSGSTLFAIARYNADGTPDLGFAVSGKTTDSPGNAFSIANGLAIQSDGKIVVAGWSYVSGNIDFAVARYNANGSLDATFNGTGKVTT
ncbi:MAG: Calx-beta domain-containing protein, partial [Myxococcaceae bacterium]